MVKVQWMMSAMILATMVPVSLIRADADAPLTGPAPERIEVSLAALLTPAYGYEEKNNVQVVLYGVLPNSCYTLAEYTTEQLGPRTFRVRQYALRDKSGMCADEASMPDHLRMIIPFMQEVLIGRLSAGEYKFVYKKSGGGNLMRAMTVSKNVTPSVDTLPYAAVSGVQARDVVMSLDHAVVKVSGVLNSTCTTLDDEVKIMRENDVMVLLPTIKVRHDVLCAQILIPFEKEVDLGSLAPGIYLVHTRSMNGKAVNKVINVVK